MNNFVRDIFNPVFDFLFPIHCFSCSEEGDKYFCKECLSKLPRAEQKCIVCRKPSLHGFTHGGCKTKNYPDGLFTFLSYKTSSLATAIIAGKYKFIPKVFEDIAEYSASSLKEQKLEQMFAGFILVPLPLGKWRKRWRGFNQSEIIANSLAKTIDAVPKQLLVKTRETKIQKDLKLEQRLQNVKSCFALKENSSLEGKNFLLIDDVTTTGATLLEAAKVLKQNGADKVWCLALAQD